MSNIKSREKIRISKSLRGAIFALFKPFVKLLYRCEVKGLKNIPRGPKIFAPNHVSIADSFVLGAVIDRQDLSNLIFVSKDNRVGFIKPFIEKMGILSFGRDNRLVLSRASNALKSSYNLLIYPEGTRAKDVITFRKGFILIAKESKAPIVPVALIKRGFKYQIHFLEPIAAKEERDNGLLAEEVREVIADKIDSAILAS